MVIRPHEELNRRTIQSRHLVSLNTYIEEKELADHIGDVQEFDEEVDER